MEALMISQMNHLCFHHSFKQAESIFHSYNLLSQYSSKTIVYFSANIKYRCFSQIILKQIARLESKIKILKISLALYLIQLVYHLSLMLDLVYVKVKSFSKFKTFKKFYFKIFFYEILLICFFMKEQIPINFTYFQLRSMILCFRKFFHFNFILLLSQNFQIFMIGYQKFHFLSKFIIHFYFIS